MTTTTTYYYRQNDDYSFDVEMDNGEVTRLHNAPNWLDGSELDYAASMLHNYTGLRVARVVSQRSG